MTKKLKGYFSAEELATQSGYSKRWICELVKNGKIKGEPVRDKRGSPILIPVSEAKSFLRSLKKGKKNPL